MKYSIFLLLIIIAIISPIKVGAEIISNQTFQSQFPNYYNYAANIFGFHTTGTSTNPVNIQPSQNNCGSYALYNPLQLNFGDPSCTFTKPKLLALLQQLDSVNHTNDAGIWFNTVVSGESGYQPNAYFRCGGGYCTPDANGAWGMYQMGSSVNGPGKSGNGQNGQYDRGDVSWELQTTNAINYNLELAKKSIKWHYWSTACSYWQNFPSVACEYVH